jgi:cohesin complex subunit SCC1
MGSDAEATSKSPRLELGEDDEALNTTDRGLGERSVGPDGTILEIPADEGFAPQDDDDHQPREGSPMPAFDDTTMPIVHPEDSGPVSLGTKHAVHVLRDLFGAEAATNEEKRKKTSVVFQDLLPAERTTKADATKMFFECLVLATKDAVKVEQKEGSLGGPIRVRGKRGLWGAWAEREAGGEIANQQDEDAQQQPEPAIANSSRTVAAAA